MTDANKLNPYAAANTGPATESVVPTAESSESSLLEKVRIELVRHNPWLMRTGIPLLVFAGIAFLITVYSVLKNQPLEQLVNNIFSVFLYGVSGRLLLRCAGKTKDFLQEPQPSKLEDVFAAEGDYWKFVTAATLLSVLFIMVAVALMLWLGGPAFREAATGR